LRNEIIESRMAIVLQNSIRANQNEQCFHAAQMCGRDEWKLMNPVHARLFLVVFLQNNKADDKSRERERGKLQLATYGVETR